MLLNLVPVDKTTWFFPTRGLKCAESTHGTPLLNHQSQGTAKHLIKNLSQYIKARALAYAINAM
jgi:hypothetical protein